MLVPEAAVGAITAACVAALFSVISLIISKEQKVSEFRQLWVDSLRSDLADYIAHVNSVIDLRNTSFENEERRSELLGPIFSSLNTASFSIQLKLNWREDQSQKILRSMSDLREAISKEPYTDHRKLREAEEQLIISAQILLKSEWTRVKLGETTYRWAKRIAIAVFVVLLIASVILFLYTISNLHTTDSDIRHDVETTVRLSLRGWNE